jgi:hypothetical protein
LIKKFQISILIPILIGLSLPTVVVSECFKIGKLFEHFSTHQQQDPEHGLLDFIQMHYLQTGLPDEDHEQDQQLPFKTIPSTPTIVMATPQLFTRYKSIMTNPQNVNYKLCHFDGGEIISFNGEIWLPPKIS